ncbi:MAG TPA: Ig-like domain-containing protein [Armatimonadota bacterium]|nr:Ig-like domain-containing protein [Armatimonadota bacterium]
MSNNTGAVWTDIVLAKPVKGRFVTVRVKSNWGGNTIAANEVELYAQDAGTPGAAAAPPTGKAPDANATAVTKPANNMTTQPTEAVNQVNGQNNVGQTALAIRVTSPSMNADIGQNANIALTAEASAPAAIARVDFFDDGKLVGSATQAPYALSYHSTTAKLNYCITAKVTDVDGHSATSLPVTCVATSKVQRQYTSYDYEETSENILKQVRLSIPTGMTTVRGILVVSNPSGGDTRNAFREAWYGEFFYLHNFAFLGTKGFDSHVESLQVMQHALAQIAAESNHPELVNVPYVTTGFSAGGGFASRLLVEVPHHVIASVPVSSRINFTNHPPSAANLQTPACIISGEKEAILTTSMSSTLASYRPNNALYGWMTIQNGIHTRSGQEVLAMPLLDTAVRLRYPADGDVQKGPIVLKPIDPNSGWVADNNTWKNGLTSIMSANKFHSALTSSSWLPSEDIAFIYRAYATYDRPLSIASPQPGWSGNRVWDPGSNVTIVVNDATFGNWKKLEFFDMAHKLGELTQGAAQFTAANLTAGFHVFSVLGTDAQGNVRTSNPVLVVVRSLPAKSN